MRYEILARARAGKMAVRTPYCSPLLGSLSENGLSHPADDKLSNRIVVRMGWGLIKAGEHWREAVTYNSCGACFFNKSA